MDGAYAGETRIVRKEFATIGRHPSADIPFDPKLDLEVSGRHAAVFFQNGEWVVRDLGSTNGTWVNGAKLKGDRPLVDGDVIRLGSTGPQIVFHARQGEPPTVPMTRLESAAPSPGRRAASTGSRVRLEVRRQTTAWKRLTIGISLLALVASLGLVVVTVQRNRAALAERNELLARTDSLLARMQASAAAVGSLTTALQEARGETERLRSELAGQGVSAARRDSLSAALSSSLQRHEGVVRAAELDVAAIAKGNADAVGLVLSEFADGRRATGTGFSVRVRGDTGWIATNRHLVADSSGRVAVRLGIIFNGSSQNFRAELVGTADSADLAVLKVRVRGGVPAVRSLHGTPGAGDPVAIFGFPFGFDFPVGGDWRKVGVHLARFSGTIRRLGPDRIELSGYGASGSSGSPVFGADGSVVAMVFGGAPGSAGQLVYAVPVNLLLTLLGRLSLTPE